MRKILNFVGFFVCVILLYKGIAYCVVDENSLNRLKYHEFYNSNNLKVVTIGPSSTLEGFDTKIANESLNKNTFNMGTSSQQMEGMYYQTKEVLKNQDVETIILDVEFPVLSRKVGAIKPIQIMTDYMRGWNKVQFITETLDRSQWMMMFSRVYREHDTDLQTVKNNLKAKSSDGYRDYLNYNSYYTNYNNYETGGFNRAIKTNEEYDFFMFPDSYSEFDSTDEPIMADQIKYLEDTIKLCKNSDVDVILVTYPKTNFYLQKSGDYDQMYHYIQKIADRYEIPYYDLNYLQEVDWTDNYFANLDHCSTEGAELVTKYICRILNGDEPAFYKNISDKYQRDIVGVLYEENENENKTTTLSWTIESDTDRQFSYKILQKDETGKLIGDSGIISASRINLPQIECIVELEIYDAQTGEYLGKAKK